MNTNGKSFEIINGPSRDTLFDAVKYAFDKSAIIPIQFDVTSNRAIVESGQDYNSSTRAKDLEIVYIEHEDGSGHSFNIYGRCSIDAKFNSGYRVIYERYKFRAYYNAKTRKGFICLVE